MIANDYKGIADSVHYKSENVQKFLKVAGNMTKAGEYGMPRHSTELPLTDNQRYYLQSQGFRITSELVSWH